MSSAYAQSFDPNRSSKRRRAFSFSLAIIAHILVILLLIRLAPHFEAKPPEVRNPVSFQMIPDADNREKPKTQAKAVTKVKQATSGRVAHAPTPNPPPPAKNPPPPVDMSLFGDRSLFAASDIGKIHNAPSESEGSGRGSGKDSVAAYGPGEGPGGQSYYEGDWYRLPTKDQLAYYMPPNMPRTGKARILCREIAHYHVENCRAIDETPPGSGVARSLREASWQFLIRPPQVGGKPLIGVLVMITYQWTTEKATFDTEMKK